MSSTSVRTNAELIGAALCLRGQLIQEGKEPRDGAFHVNLDELGSLTILLQPETLSVDRLCGLKVAVVEQEQFRCNPDWRNAVTRAAEQIETKLPR